jgi:Zn-dependent protease
LAIFIYVNVLLTVFNLIPIPPLDGSKLLFAILPVSEYTKATLEQYGFVFLFVIIFVFQGLLSVLLYCGLSLFSKSIIGVGPEFIFSLTGF